MAKEKDKAKAERSQRIENYNLIKKFFDALKENGLAVKPTWTPEEASVVQKLSTSVAASLPQSVRSIEFPNHGKIIFGEKEDPTRVAAWDLLDVRKFALRLSSMGNL